MIQPQKRRKPTARIQKPKRLVSTREQDLIDAGLKTIYGAEGSMNLDLQSVSRPSLRWLAWFCLAIGLLLITTIFIYLSHRELWLMCFTNIRSFFRGFWESIRSFYR